MSQDQVDEKDSSPKSRILRLFRFLYEVNRLRNRPERTLQEQVFVVPLSRLPEHPAIQLVRPVVTEGQSPATFEITIGRARTTRCVAPPLYAVSAYETELGY